MYVPSVEKKEVGDYLWMDGIGFLPTSQLGIYTYPLASTP